MLFRGGAGADGEQLDLLPYQGDLAYINGDDQTRHFALDREVDPISGDRIVIRYRNVDAVNAHELILDVGLEFRGAPTPPLQAVSYLPGGDS